MPRAAYIERAVPKSVPDDRAVHPQAAIAAETECEARRPIFRVGTPAHPLAPPALPQKAVVAVEQPTQAAEFSRFYVTTMQKFWVAVSLSGVWAVASFFVSLPWIADIARFVGYPAALTTTLFLAFIPGFLNMFVVISLLMDKPKRIPVESVIKLPDITVLVAAYNEEKCIGTTLTTIYKQAYPGRIETIVIDDGSTDRTREIVRDAARKNRRIRLLRASHGGKANALNKGLRYVTTKYCLTVDADTHLHKDAIKRLMIRFKRAPAGTVAVAGAVLVKNSRDTFMTRLQDWDYSLAIASIKRVQSLHQGVLVAQGAFSAYETAKIREVGGWPDMIGEDIVLTWALLERGGRTDFEATAVSFTDTPTTLGAFARQRRRWARGMIEGLKKYGNLSWKRRGRVGVMIATDFLFPVMDFVFSLVFIPGLVLAAFGHFYIVGPLTLAVIPLTFTILYVMYRKQKAVFEELGLKFRRNAGGFVFYALVYQLIMAPVCTVGYMDEFFSTRKQW
jgi:poly-beta-1,6-N-acetyl-D-glucosamine synthase